MLQFRRIPLHDMRRSIVDEPTRHSQEALNVLECPAQKERLLRCLTPFQSQILIALVPVIPLVESPVRRSNLKLYCTCRPRR